VLVVLVEVLLRVLQGLVLYSQQLLHLVVVAAEQMQQTVFQVALVAVVARRQQVHLRVQELLVKVLLAVLALMAYLHLRLVAVVVVLVQLVEIQEHPLVLRWVATVALVKYLAYLVVVFFMLVAVVVVQIMVEGLVQPEILAAA
jgi:hypothetical protein